jgi:hypothetical protein
MLIGFQDVIYVGVWHCAQGLRFWTVENEFRGNLCRISLSLIRVVDRAQVAQLLTDCSILVQNFCFNFLMTRGLQDTRIRVTCLPAMYRYLRSREANAATATRPIMARLSNVTYSISLAFYFVSIA